MSTWASSMFVYIAYVDESDEQMSDNDKGDILEKISGIITFSLSLAFH